MKGVFFRETSYSIFKARRVGFFILVLLFVANPLSVAEDAVKNAANEIVGKPPEIKIELVEGGESLVNLGEDYYFGVFIDADRVWGKQDDPVDIENQKDLKKLDLSITDEAPEGTLLIGRELKINGKSVGIRIDGGLPEKLASIDNPDSEDLTEATELDDRWLVTAQAGFKLAENLVTSGGLAMARVSDSVINIEMGGDKPSLENINDSPSKEAIQLGLVVGFETEVSLGEGSGSSRSDKAWVLQMKGTYVNLGDNCETQSLLNPCSTKTVRFAIIRRF